MDETTRRLDKIDVQLSDIKDTLAKMAVQDEKISHQQSEISALRIKTDRLSEEINICRNWQASCPRTTVNWVWAVLIPMGLGILYMITRGGAP